MPVYPPLCSPTYYRKLRKCSDGTLVDIGMTRETVLALSVTVANSLKYGGVCYYLDSTETTTRPGTVLAAGDVTKYDCCNKCNGGATCCTNCGADTPNWIPLTFTGVSLCTCGSGIGDYATMVGNLNGTFDLPINTGCTYSKNFIGVIEAWSIFVDCTRASLLSNTLTLTATRGSLGLSVTAIMPLPGPPFFFTLFSGTLTGNGCNGGMLTNTYASCTGGTHVFGIGGSVTLL